MKQFNQKKHAFVISSVIHVIFLGTIAMTALFQFFKKPPEHVFEMVEIDEPVMEEDVEAPPENVLEINAPELSPFEAQPPPEIRRPEPMPAPVYVAPKPIKKPEQKHPTPPKPIEAPKAEPKPELPKISAKDFFNKNPPKKQKPKSSPPKTVQPYKIQTPTVKVTSDSKTRKASSAYMNSLLAAYKTKLHRLIKLAWEKPGTIKGGGVFAKVEFTVLAQGRLTNIRIIESSGHTVFNKTAINAVKQTREAGPVPTRKAETFSILFNLNEG